MVYNSVTGTMTTVGALPAGNGALNFGVSNSGYVVGSSMFNQGAGNAFLWSASGGMTAIALPSATSQGSARAVNDSGWTVGTAVEPVRINLALQGGGSHGAFTWGVLDRLLDDDSIGFDGVSGTSAGALNAAVLATGLADGGRPGAQAALRAFWLDVAAQQAPFG